MAQRLKINVYGSEVVLSNIRNNIEIPIFGRNENITATRVTRWWDGSIMDDSKVDGEVFLKLRTLPLDMMEEFSQYIGSYFRVNLPNWGETFLQKPNVDSLRSMSPTEILLLRMGYYKGVNLLGYYAENGGDTPASIEYYLSDTEEIDDGGSVFEVEGIKLEHEFKGSIDLSYYGFLSGEDSTDNFVNYMSAIKRLNINIVNINKSIEIRRTVEVSDINSLNFVITKDVKFTPFRGIRFVNCPHLYIEGEVNGLGVSIVGITLNNCPYFIMNNLRVIDFGNEDVNQVRGLELLGDCSFGKIDKCRFENIISSAVATGVDIKPSEDGLSWSQHCSITNSDFINIQPSTDADAIKTLLLRRWAYLTIDNCYFEDCAKRAFKSQSRGDTISNCTINGASRYPIDFQDGHGKAFNIQGTITTTWEALLSATNYNVEFSNIEFKTTLSPEELTSQCRGIDITKIPRTIHDGLYSGFFKITNVYLEKISEIRVRVITDVDLQIDDLRVGQCITPFLFSFNQQTITYLKIINSSLEEHPSPFYAVANGINGINDVFIKDNKFSKSFINGRSTLLKGKNVQYLDNEMTQQSSQVLNYIQEGTKRTYIGVTGAPSSSVPLYLDSTEGDVAYHRTPQTSGIEKYICTASGNGVDNVGSWTPVYLPSIATTSKKGTVNQATASPDTAEQAAGATPTKEEFDALLAELRDLKTKARAAGILAT